jgi:cupin fold WbuC family metalloprotein
MIIDKKLLDSITEQAKKSPRLRMNYNLHGSLDAKAQRLFNALEPGTVLPVHRHVNTAESYILIRGKLNVIFYDDDSKIIEKTCLDLSMGKYGVHIPAGQWHTLEVLESGTIIFEVKDGPYTPITPDNLLLKNL